MAYAYNDAGLRTGPNNQLLFDGIYSYLYDPEGNRTARFIDVNANGLLDAGDTAATTYAWDHRNRLTRVTDYDLYGDPATRAVDYLYDTENRWIGRDVDLDGDGQIDTRTCFAYDGNQIVMQFGGLSHSSGTEAGTVPFSDPLTVADLSHRYLWNPAAVDQLMADEHVTTDPSSPGSILWPLADHLGTIRDLAAYDSSTDATTVVNHRTFDAYGNLLTQTNPAHDTLFAFTARPFDQETSLQNNLHRWYDTATGRWMSEDPIGFEGREANLNRYVGNSPVNATDPTGRQMNPIGEGGTVVDDGSPYTFGWEGKYGYLSIRLSHTFSEYPFTRQLNVRNTNSAVLTLRYELSSDDSEAVARIEGVLAVNWWEDMSPREREAIEEFRTRKEDETEPHWHIDPGAITAARFNRTETSFRRDLKPYTGSGSYNAKAREFDLHLDISRWYNRTTGPYRYILAIYFYGKDGVKIHEEYVSFELQLVRTGLDGRWAIGTKYSITVSSATPKQFEQSRIRWNAYFYHKLD